MWPIKKKKTILPGVFESNKGDLLFDLTSDEKKAVDGFLKRYEGYGIKKEYYDDIIAGSTAKALSNYAHEKVDHFMSSQNQNELDIAIASITKAYSIYPMPIFMYELALYMDIAGRHEETKDLYRMFLEKQADIGSDPVIEFLYSHDYLELAIEDAKLKTRNS